MFLISLVHLNLSGQNLVPNGSFEEYKEIPYEFRQWYLCKYWTNTGLDSEGNIDNGTPDYYHTKSGGTQNLPNSSYATVYPHSGEAVMAFLVKFDSGAGYNFREYLSCKLISNLEEGVFYRVSFWITNGEEVFTLGDKANGIGVYFSTDQIHQQGTGPINVTPQFEIVDELWSTEWLNFNFYIYADSSYSYFTIGNFNDDENTLSSQVVDTGHEGAYYFLDDIEVEQVEIIYDTICYGETIKLIAPLSSTYTWSEKTIPLTDISSESTVEVAPLKTTSYYFQSNENIFEHKIIVEECPELVMPNVFTPNNDLVNDYLIPSFTRNVTNVNILIYNRWGDLVFSGDVMQEGWDGYYDGEKCSDGVYFWILDYVGVYGGMYSSNGLIHLVSG